VLNIDVGDSCTWQDMGKNSPGTAEIYTCPQGASFAEDRRCANVGFTSPYTQAEVTARVAVRRGSTSCPTARGVIGRALSVKHAWTGAMSYWSVAGWECSSGGDGTVTVCNRAQQKIESTTPTAGGSWSNP
jgi:hypothetical protein